MKDFSGKTAFITGGAAGIGLGIARALADEGMRLMIADIRAETLAAAVAELRGRGADADGLTLDVADRAAFAAAERATTARFGPVHLLINNAGVNLFAAMDDCSYDDWDWILGVNLGGVVNGIQSFVPGMKQHGQGGHIVNTASMAGFISGPGTGIYTTSKFAVRGLSESLRWALAKYKIGVSCLCPGLVNSDIHLSEALRQESFKAHATSSEAQFAAVLPDIQKLGMSPDEVGIAVLAGIRANAAYIFPHPEFRDELRDIFDAILAAVPQGEVDSRRLAFENTRRERVAVARRSLSQE